MGLSLGVEIGPILSVWTDCLPERERILEDEPPIFLNLRLQLGASRNAAPIDKQAPPGCFLIEFESQYTQIALMLLLFARELADEDIVIVDDKNAEFAKLSEPVPAVLPVSR